MSTESNTIAVSFTLEGITAVALVRQLAAYNTLQQISWNQQENTKKSANPSYTPVPYTPVDAPTYAATLGKQSFSGLASQELTRRLKDPVQGPALEAFLSDN